MLGRLDVIDDAGEPVSLTSLRQRQLLAVLLCRPGRSAPAELLMDALWGDAPPASAAQNLQTYVHRLRRSLGDHRIRFESPSYTVRVEPGELDADRFEELSEAGRRALGEGDPSRARNLLSEALGQWRDEPYVDLDSGERPDVVELESTRLRELRLAVVEEWAEAELALGKHGDLAAELTTYLNQHPLRERLRGQVMRALYRSGRAADALETYRTGRRLLVDELGMEPGAELRELERAILSEDPALDPPAPATSAPRTVPAELPATPRGFTGRTRELERIAGWLADDTPGHALVAISGGGGIGKSALALQAADRMRSAFPDGQLYVNLRGDTPYVEPVPAADVLPRLLRALGLDDAGIPADVDEAAARFRSLTSGRRILIVLDNAADSTQVRPLLPGTGGAAVLVTSRRVLTALDDALLLSLPTLPERDAIDLLGAYAGPERVASDTDTAATIAGLCGHLPLALRIAGARLAARADWTLDDLAERLADTRSRLDELTHDDLAARTSCQTSYHGLPPQSAELFELLGLLDVRDVTPAVVAALADRSPADVRRDLDQLVDAQLLDCVADRYSLHDLVRLYAREQATARLDESARTLACRRVVHHYLATARQTMQVFTTAAGRRREIGLSDDQLIQAGAHLPDRAAVLDWIRGEADNLVTVAEHARQLPEAPEALSGLLAAIVHAFRSQTLELPLVTIARLALDSLPDERTQRRAMAHYDLAYALASFSRPSDEWHAHLRSAIELFDALQDQPGLAAALETEGLFLTRFGRVREGTEVFRRARALRRQLGDSAGEGNLLHNMAIAANVDGRREEAIALLGEALPLFDPDDDRRRGVTLANIGEGLCETGRPAAAVEHLENALELLHRTSLSRIEAKAAWNLARALDQLDRRDDAARRREEALSHFLEIGIMTERQVEDILASDDPKLPDDVDQAIKF